MIRILTLAAVLTAAASAPRTGKLGSGSEGMRAPVRHSVTIEKFAFMPDTLVVQPGDTVVWRNSDLVPHTATAADSSWDSGLIAAGEEWLLVIAEEAVTEYFCRYHPAMLGSLRQGG